MKRLPKYSERIAGQSPGGRCVDENHKGSIANLWRTLCVAGCETGRFKLNSAPIQVSRSRLRSSLSNPVCILRKHPASLNMRGHGHENVTRIAVHAVFVPFRMPRYDERWRTRWWGRVSDRRTLGRCTMSDNAGAVLAEIPPGRTLGPGEWRVYSEADGSWPVGVSSLKVEANGPVHSFVTLRSHDGSALEIIPPSSEPASREPLLYQ